MAEYTPAAITIDPETLFQGATAFLQARMPLWNPADPNLDVWMLEAVAQIGAQVAETAQDVPTGIFRRFGKELVGIPSLDPSPAGAVTTWTAIDTNGPYRIPEGTVIGFDGPEGALGFATTVEATIPNGKTVVEGVPVVATESGAAGNSFTGAAQLQDQLDFVQSVAVVGLTSGGTDGETDDEYLSRLVEELQLQSPRPILPADFAVLARRVAGVGRALAINGYNPANGTYGNERTVTVAVCDALGETVTAGIRAEVDALLQGMREVNFVVNVIDPTYKTITVTYSGTAWPGWDPEAVKAAANAALAEALSPALAGQPPTGSTREWVSLDKVRYLEVAQVLNNVAGFRYINELKVNGGTADVELTGPATLTKAGTITGTVTA